MIYSKDVVANSRRVFGSIRNMDAFAAIGARTGRPEVDELLALAKACGLECVPIYRSPTFKAALWRTFVLYNPDQHPDDVVTELYHEVHEFKVSADTPILFGDEWTAQYTGASAPKDTRHLSARYAEICLREVFPMLTTPFIRWQRGQVSLYRRCGLEITEYATSYPLYVRLKGRIRLVNGRTFVPKEVVRGTQ